MTRRLILTYVTLTAFALALLAIPLGITFAHREHDRLLFDAEREANSIAATIDDPLESHTALPRQAIADSAQRTGADIVIVDTARQRHRRHRQWERGRLERGGGEGLRRRAQGHPHVRSRRAAAEGLRCRVHDRADHQ